MRTEELKEWGLSDDQISSVMAQFGKDISKLQRENEKLTLDKDTWKQKAEDAENTLKGFDGIDISTIQSEIATWKQRAKEAEENAKAQIYERDYADTLKSELESVKFTSEAAKRDVISQIKASNLPLKDGKIMGLSDFIENIKSSDASAFVDERQEKLEAGKARFTTIEHSSGGIPQLSKKEIMNIKDSTERQNAIANNLGLFGKERN